MRVIVFTNGGVMIDVDRIRADTPGVNHVIHFNNAGAALMPTPVIEAMTDHLALEARIGGYEAANANHEMVGSAYASVANLVGGDVAEIAMLDSSTTAWDRIIYSLPHGPGDRILTTTTEYGSNWAAYLQLTERFGIDVVVVPDSESGEVDVAAMEALIDDRTTLISLNHMPTNGGVVNPAEAVGRIARSAGVPFLLDACQTVGQVPIDVGAIGCTFLTATSRKFLRGPRGLGAAWVSSDAIDQLDPVFADNHSAFVTDTSYTFRSDARRLETWERSYVILAGFATAVDYAGEIGVDLIWDRIRHLASVMRDGLRATDGVTVLDRGSVLGGIVSFAVDGRNAIEVKEHLSEQGINVSYSTVNSSPHDMRMRELTDLVRASVHVYNTEDEIEAFLGSVAVIAG